MANPKQDKTHLEPQAPAKLSRVATIRKDAQPKIGMFIAVRFLLEDPKKDQDEWIWEFGKVCSINKKRKIPHSILFVEHDGASKTYELALNDLPQDENSKEICAWVALDGVYPEDMTAYRVLKRSQAAVKAAASVDPTNMQDPVKKRQVEESAQQVPVKRAKGVVAGAAVQGSEAKAGTKGKATLDKVLNALAFFRTRWYFIHAKGTALDVGEHEGIKIYKASASSRSKERAIPENA
eukprot:jgi/Mesvir1/15788/Mv03354-RA.1